MGGGGGGRDKVVAARVSCIIHGKRFIYIGDSLGCLEYRHLRNK